MIHTNLSPFIKEGSVSSTAFSSLDAKFLNYLSKVVKNLTLSLASPNNLVSSFY